MINPRYILVCLLFLLPFQACTNNDNGSSGGGGGGTFTVSTTTAPFGIVGSNYSATLATSGGTAPMTWSLVGGTLPAGLLLNGAAGTVTGTPTAAGNSTATFTVRDSTGQTATGSVL